MAEESKDTPDSADADQAEDTATGSDVDSGGPSTAPSTSTAALASDAASDDDNPPVARSGLMRSLAGLHALPNKDKVAALFAVMVSVALVLPWLGSVGFFDPWESHYGEVARQMAVRDDYLYPFWKDAYFFSKPIGLFWATALGYKLVGAGNAEGELSWMVEWVGRLPMAALSILCIFTVTFTVRRLWSTRAAVLSAVVLATSPFWAFMSRQAITDMLYVAPMSCALLLLALAFIDDDSKEHFEKMRIPWWMIGCFGALLLPQLWEIGRSGSFLNRVTALGSEAATRLAFSAFLCAVATSLLVLLQKKGRDPVVHAAAAFVAVGTLGKGPHTLAFTGLVLLLYFIVSGQWKQLRRPALLSGIALYLAIAAPWYIVMYFFEGKNSQRKTWFQRFVLYDLLGRLGKGAHGDRGTFEYYARYLGFGMMPWSGFAPVAFIHGALASGSGRVRTKEQRFSLFVALWMVTLFVFFGATTTKFHHYALPIVVPACMLIGRWLDDVLAGRAKVTGVIVAFLILTIALIGRDLASEPWQFADLFTYHYKSYKPAYYFPTHSSWRVAVGAVSLVCALLILWGTVSDARGVSFARRTGNDLAALPSILSRGVLAGGGRVRAAGFVGASLIAALVFSVWAVYGYHQRISQHWSQRWLVQSYFEERQPGEPLLSFQMDWKGETFYAHNHEIQIKKKGADLKKRCDEAGREFVLVQQDRFKTLKSALGKSYKDRIQIINRSNTKWYLVLVQ